MVKNVLTHFLQQQVTQYNVHCEVEINLDGVKKKLETNIRSALAFSEEKKLPSQEFTASFQ
jgi:hypothetical protein